MHTIRKLIALSTEYLEKKGASHPRRYAEELLAYVLKKERMELYFIYDSPIEKEEVDQFRMLLEKKGEGIPLEYVIGKITFFNCEFELSPHVLIPRQETEILVDKISNQIEGTILWDLCCGSGCIGLSLKKRFPHLEVSLSDISAEAIACARRNGKINELEVFYHVGDLLTPFKGQKAHMITCNPPYISQAEYEALDRSVKAYEPQGALLSGESGYEFYERLSEELPHYLHPGGKVFFECGASQGDKIKEIFSDSCWVQKKCEQDWAGHDRFFFLEFHS